MNLTWLSDVLVTAGRIGLKRALRSKNLAAATCAFVAHRSGSIADGEEAMKPLRFWNSHDLPLRPDLLSCFIHS